MASKFKWCVPGLCHSFLLFSLCVNSPGPDHLNVIYADVVAARGVETCLAHGKSRRPVCCVIYYS